MPHICINPIPVMTYRLLRTAALALLLAYGSIAQAAPKAKPAPKAATSKSAPAKSDKSNKNQPKEKSKSKTDPIGKIIKNKQQQNSKPKSKPAENSKTKTRDNGKTKTRPSQAEKTKPQSKTAEKTKSQPKTPERGKPAPQSRSAAKPQPQRKEQDTDEIGTIIRQSQERDRLAKVRPPAPPPRGDPPWTSFGGASRRGSRPGGFPGSRAAFRAGRGCIPRSPPVRSPGFHAGSFIFCGFLPSYRLRPGGNGHAFSPAPHCPLPHTHSL